MTQPLLPPEHLRDHEWHWVKSRLGRASAVAWRLGQWWWPSWSWPHTPDEAAKRGYLYIAPAYPPTDTEAAKLREAQ